MNIMLCGQLKNLYISYMVLKRAENRKNHKAGDAVVTGTEDKRNYRRD